MSEFTIGEEMEIYKEGEEVEANATMFGNKQWKRITIIKYDERKNNENNCIFYNLIIMKNILVFTTNKRKMSKKNVDISKIKIKND